MRKFINIISALIILLVTFSCNKDFLNETPKSLYNESVVWSDPNLAQAFVNEMYRGLEYTESVNMLSSFVDETDFTPDWGTLDFDKCLITQDRIPELNSNDIHYGALSWARLYKQVRSCNVFFANIDKVNFSTAPSSDEKSMKDRLKGEVFFWRAYFYYHLTGLYGAVPYVTKAYSLTDSVSSPRNTYEECVNLMVQDLDSAANLLPNVQFQSGDNKGRVTKGVALTLKSRVLLHAASDLHNPDKNSSITAGYAHPELLGYTSSNNTARWQAAKDAAKDVMNLNLYELYKKTPATPDEATKNYGDIFLLSQTSEDIFVRYFVSKINEDWNSYSPGKYVGPNGYHNWGNNTPIGEFVDSYEMTDGSKFDWTDPAEATNPYVNRDPRFYASVLYEGAPWRQRPTDAVQYDPFNKIQVGEIGYYNGIDWVPLNIGANVAAGLDTRKGQIENWNGGYTGYYMKKFIDPTVDAQFFNQENPWRYMRYAEVILNYAEACIELGQEPEARTYINMIRTRARMPDVTETGVALKDRYRNERKIELAFEEHRFFDVRRWMLGSVAYSGIYKVQVRYVVPQATVLTGYRKSDGTTWTAPEYKNVLLSDRLRAWDNKAYFMPILRDELNRNKNLIENPGY